MARRSKRGNQSESPPGMSDQAEGIGWDSDEPSGGKAAAVVVSVTEDSFEDDEKLKNPSNRTHQSTGENDRQSTTSSDIPRDAMQKDSNEISL